MDRPYLVLISIYNKYYELEDEITITAQTRKGVRRKATNWIKKHLFSCDYNNIDHGYPIGRRDYWTIK